MADHELEIGGDKSLIAVGDALLDAIDLASDQDGRTWITAGGKRIARIVTVEDGERLERTPPHVIHSGQVVSWGPVADSPWKPS